MNYLEIKKTLIKCMSDIGFYIDEKDFDIVSFDDYDIDSMTYIQLIVEVENTFAIEFPATYLSNNKLSTFNELALTIENLII